MFTHIAASIAALITSYIATVRSLTAAELGQITVVVTIYTALIFWIIRSAQRRRRELRAAQARLLSVRLYDSTYQVSEEAAAKLRCAALRDDVERAIANTKQRLEAAPPRDRRPALHLDHR